MIAVTLDTSREERLRQLAETEGVEAEQLAQHVLEDYLDLRVLPLDDDQAWAEASIELSKQVFASEDWT